MCQRLFLALAALQSTSAVLRIPVTNAPDAKIAVVSVHAVSNKTNATAPAVTKPTGCGDLLSQAQQTVELGLSRVAQLGTTFKKEDYLTTLKSLRTEIAQAKTLDSAEELKCDVMRSKLVQDAKAELDKHAQQSQQSSEKLEQEKQKNFAERDAARKTLRDLQGKLQRCTQKVGNKTSDLLASQKRIERLQQQSADKGQKLESCYGQNKENEDAKNMANAKLKVMLASMEKETHAKEECVRAKDGALADLKKSTALKTSADETISADKSALVAARNTIQARETALAQATKKIEAMDVALTEATKKIQANDVAFTLASKAALAKDAQINKTSQELQEKLQAEEASVAMAKRTSEEVQNELQAKLAALATVQKTSDEFEKKLQAKEAALKELQNELQAKDAALAALKGEAAVKDRALEEFHKNLKAKEDALTSQTVKTNSQLQAMGAELSTVKGEVQEKDKTSREFQKKLQAFTKLVRDQEDHCKAGCSWYTPTSCTTACIWQIPSTFLESA